MSFFGRIKDWFSATAHDTMDKVEDPEKMANEYLRQLNDQYYQAKTQVAQAMADETRLEQKMLEAQNEVEKFQGMAETALRSSKGRPGPPGATTQDPGATYGHPV